MDLRQAKPESLDLEFEFKQRVLEAASSTALFSQVFFQEHFSLPFGAPHRDLFQIIDDPRVMRAAIAAPRGMGKTTTLDLGYAARIAANGQAHFIIIVSNTLDQAVMQLDTLKVELETNDLLKATYGDLRGPVWQAEKIVLSNGCMIWARGAQQQIRGLKYGRFRPDHIFCDDLEESEAVMNENSRQKLRNWFYKDLMRAGQRSGRDCRIIIIGTILHEDSLLQNLLEDPDFSHLIISAFDDDLNPTWPEYMSREDVQKLYDSYAAVGMLDALAQEYQNKCVSSSNKCFGSYLYYAPGDIMHSYVENLIHDNQALRCVIVDPAKTLSASADYSAFMALVIDTQAGSLYFHDLYHARLEPEMVLQEAFNMADALATPLIFIEETGLNLWMTTVARSAMMSRTRLYDINPLKAIGNKLERIKLLAPMYKIGMIHHNRACRSLREYEQQLAMYPRSRKDDLSDVAAYSIPILRDSAGWDFSATDPRQVAPRRDRPFTGVLSDSYLLNVI